MAKILAHGWPESGCCANCDTPLAGGWCHLCGQRAGDHHHSLRHLAMEAIEGLTHADGRLWHTLTLLVIRPATLTNDYLRGRRIREIPPLRLFFVTLLIVFAVGSLAGHPLGTQIDTKDLAGAHKALDSIVIEGSPRLSAWLRSHLLRAVDHPELLLEAVSRWAERFAFLLAPMSALALRLLFPLRRDRPLFDHLVFALHSLSLVGIVWVVIIALAPLGLDHGPLVMALLLTMPVHLYRHMRGVYGTGRWSTLWRMALLFILTIGVFLVLLTGLAVVSLSTL